MVFALLFMGVSFKRITFGEKASDSVLLWDGFKGIFPLQPPP